MNSETPDNRRARTAAIKHKARELGFHKVGIVPAVALDAEREHLEAWFVNGFHADMNWMRRDDDATKRRTDPREIFAGARSVIVVALNYFTAHEHEESPAHGKLSRYAWGDDYHDVVGEKLRALLAWMSDNFAGAAGKACCDIQPMMDKAWAVRAGLGWIGKHSNVITRDYGSWVFLGELITNLELEYDTQIESDHCGSCRLCIEACPTDAIIADRIVDARKCISYQTIESRAATLPDDIAHAQNGWLYGCDICQDVCPWNRFEKPTAEERFTPRANETALELVQVLAWTQEEYAARFRHSAIKRAKLSGLRRNAQALLQASSETSRGDFE
ncbi:MAG: tRNA epoxyqueuosine(34) reductase QueG [Pyrinomonadaceae bacterium MAG19_C2-C3]|nr:tRNA epoxyqueuosine(34) reductase QueG [Pyrinomonadaceae bacterium MAG19_C2-C3]